MTPDDVLYSIERMLCHEKKGSLDAVP